MTDFLHMMIYMFGAVVLSTVSAIALATELILKAGILWFSHKQKNKNVALDISRD